MFKELYNQYPLIPEYLNNYQKKFCTHWLVTPNLDRNNIWSTFI